MLEVDTYEPDELESDIIRDLDKSLMETIETIVAQEVLRDCHIDD